MWVAVTLAAIAGIGTAFLLWFLHGLLRARAPSVCFRVVPARRSPDKERDRELLGGIYFDGDCRAPKDERSNYYAEVLENEGHAKECASGLIALDVRPVPAKLGWRSIWATGD